jgi:hypothetical protein
MNLKELQLFVAENITYKDWEFYVKEKNGVMFLQIQFDAPDNFSPAKMERQYCRKWQLSEWMTPTEIVQTCWAAVTRAELHEAAETFRFKGKAIFDTHINVEALVNVCNAGHYEHRGEPKQNLVPTDLGFEHP